MLISIDQSPFRRGFAWDFPQKTFGTEVFRVFVFSGFIWGKDSVPKSSGFLKTLYFRGFLGSDKAKHVFVKTPFRRFHPRKTTKTDDFGTGRNGDLGVISALGEGWEGLRKSRSKRPFWQTKPNLYLVFGFIFGTSLFTLNARFRK